MLKTLFLAYAASVATIAAAILGARLQAHRDRRRTERDDSSDRPLTPQAWVERRSAA